ncbi:restriction endonuclease subunit S [Mycoplasma suis]|uniref:restriction endonuclease subunit S n=1 Tax=Mycoplasma suis TaxID=57372 RepID=UPI0005C5448D|nr:restriction endonuclease subunit S [Mycoplasma suis]
MSTKNKWELTTLDKLGKISSGKPYDRKYEFNPKLHEKSIPFVGVKEVGQSRLHILESDRHCFLNNLSKKGNKLFSKNTVCISIYGSYPGESALLKSDAFLSTSVFAFSHYENISNPKFIKYCLDSQRKTFSSISATTTIRKALPTYQLLSIKFPCPPQEEQERIGDTLSAYDELIENNERQIEVLQGVRTAIFKEWFINLRFPNYLTYETERERERE